jgi:lysophospholipase L1-like esterase
MNRKSAVSLSPEETVIACLGASDTKGEISYDWVADLQSRPENASRRFINLGVGGDPSCSALRHLPRVVQCRPDKVIVLIGGNDMAAEFSPVYRRCLVLWKRLPQAPSLPRFEENMRRIVTSLKRETSARIGLSSLPVLGEDPGSELNALAGKYNAVIQRIAREERVDYLPCYERMMEHIVRAPGGSPTSVIAPMCRAAFRVFILRQSLDEAGKAEGWQFHINGYHLNSRSGKILADLVQEFVCA